MHFGGAAGAAYRRNYMRLSVGVGEEKRPLIPEIRKRTRSYTFRHPDGAPCRNSNSNSAPWPAQRVTLNAAGDSRATRSRR